MADTARIEELRRRVQTDPASIAFAALAEEYRRAGQFDDAIATCRTGLQRHPAYLSARVTLGRSLLEIGRYDEARQELEQVLRAAPENLAAIRALAEIHHRVGELPDTEHHFPATETEPPAASSAAPPSAPQVPSARGPAPASVMASAAAGPPAVAASARPVAAQPAVPAAPQPVTQSTPQSAAPVTSRSSAPLSTTSHPVVVRPPAPARQPHPDEVALPALEAFLSAIVAVKVSESRVSH